MQYLSRFVNIWSISVTPRHVKKKKSACGSGQRSKHGLGLPILTKYLQILINIELLSIIE